VELVPSFPNVAPRPWWRRRFFKAIAITLLSIAGFYFFERQLGEYKWRAYQREAAAKGIKLQIADYETPSIPDEENYAAIPIFREPFESTIAGKRTLARLDLPSRPKISRNVALEPPLLESWQQAFVRASWIPSASDNAAVDILKAMEGLEPILSEIKHASGRPKTHWPIRWRKGFNTPISILPVLYRAAKAFGLRAKALLALNRPDDALTEIINILRLAESLKDQPSFTFEDTRVAMMALAIDLSEQGLHENKWSETHLKTLSDLIGATNELASWKVAYNGERGSVNLYLDQTMTDSGTLASFIRSLYPSATFDPLLRLAPRGWVRQGQVKFNRRIDLDLGWIDSTEERIDPQYDAPAPKSYMKDLTDILPADRLADVHYALSLGSHYQYRAFDIHVRTRQFVILSALFRYRESHGGLPESLSQLVPYYLSRIPHDIMDGQPTRYRRLENGGCLLWSIGENRIDDGGAKGPDPKRPRSNAPDWVSDLPN
jgi:hypothetical protein